MSASAPWKALERRAAKKLKGVRLWRPDFSDSQPDGESERFVWDAKCYQRHAAISLWVEAWRKYRGHANGRPLLLVLFSRERKSAGDFVLLRMEDFLTILEDRDGD